MGFDISVMVCPQMPSQNLPCDPSAVLNMWFAGSAGAVVGLCCKGGWTTFPTLCWNVVGLIAFSRVQYMYKVVGVFKDANAVPAHPHVSLSCLYVRQFQLLWVQYGSQLAILASYMGIWLLITKGPNLEYRPPHLTARQDDIIAYKHINITSLQPPRLISGVLALPNLFLVVV